MRLRADVRERGLYRYQKVRFSMSRISPYQYTQRNYTRAIYTGVTAILQLYSNVPSCQRRPATPLLYSIQHYTALYSYTTIQLYSASALYSIQPIHHPSDRRGNHIDHADPPAVRARKQTIHKNENYEIPKT